MSHMFLELTSPPSESVTACTTEEKSTCMDRGRFRPWSDFMMYATPPLPDCEFTRMTAS